MAGYSGTPLVHKLGIKDTHVVLLDGAPESLDLGDLSGALVVRRLPRAADVTLTVHTARASLTRRLPTVFERTVTDGMVWACWPKRAAQSAGAPSYPRHDQRNQPPPRFHPATPSPERRPSPAPGPL